jgi:hypothetical protein
MIFVTSPADILHEQRSTLEMRDGGGKKRNGEGEGGGCVYIRLERFSRFLTLTIK